MEQYYDLLAIDIVAEVIVNTDNGVGHKLAIRDEVIHLCGQQAE